MKDIISKYKKNKLLTNVNIILTSLVLAFWINFVLIDWTDLGQNLKTSVLNSQTQEAKSDISIENIENELFIISNKNINNLESLSLSLVYNPENINISEINSNYWDIINLSNIEWINSLILTSEKEINIKSWDKLIKISLNKKEEKSENINILNANFKDNTWEHFLLSTSWITF